MLTLRSLILFSTFAAIVFADQVILTNGDRVTGKIVKSDTKELVLRTGFAGDIKIKWTAVNAITSADPLYVHLTSGDTLAGPVTTENGEFRVTTADTGTVAASRDKVKAISSKEEEAAYERLRNPTLLDLWAGFLDTGLSAARGNASTTTFTNNMNAARITSHDKITVYFTSIYSKNKTNGTRVLGADADRGGILYT